MTRFWHPFADMSSVLQAELSIVRGEGYYIWDSTGQRYLDATASLWYCNVGHGRAEIADAVGEQMRELEAYSTFQDLTNPAAAALAERVADISPVDRSVVFFTSGGSDSIDTATKMTRRYWSLMGEPGRSVLIRRERAYHGMHTAGTSLAGLPANLEGHGQLLQDIAEVPWDDADALRSTIDGLGADRVAAFFCEPIVGAGGVFAPPPGYLETARRVCRETGVLFVADEVITGFGRTGAWFASERWSLEPDLITCAKGITSGYLPLGAVIAAPRVWEPFWAEGAGMWRHGYTYTGHAAVAAAALANLEIIEREKLLARAMELEGELADALAPLSGHELVSEVRAGCGVLAAVQIDPAALAEDRKLLGRVVPACRRAGIMTRTLATGAIHVSPPLILDAEGLKELAEGIGVALDGLASSRG
ncbi:MAG: aminotransferase class III-fold pyridoxal phosphate-dependent enzyme [Actinomycetota bacterium]|nr:aminotransferase class III-fold pyridoxal phosphate-dependent enzyme [Actinomycetota bacterium]